MTATAYALVAQVRRKELKTRIALAAFIGVASYLLAPSPWPAIWFGAVLVSQALDWAVCRPFRLKPDVEQSAVLKATCCATVALTTTVYSAITLHMWFDGGEVGRLFAMVQVAGGLLHVSLHMHHARPLLLSAVTPHAVYFLGLPVLGAVLSGQYVDLAVVIAGVLYMSHLVVAVRQSSLTTNALRTANAEAEAASAAKSDFLAVISHEIRTPMNAVISAGNLLRRTRLDAEQREHVAMLLDAGDVLVSLLNDVLDLSKIEAGKMTLESADFDLRDKLASLDRMWSPKAAEKGVRLSLEIDPAVPRIIRTDALRQQQILFNLLSNAVKFTDRGLITVRVDWCADQGLVVEVEDTGCGIPADRLTHVFASFEQADIGTTRRYGGTGLGLAISRRIAEIMNGGLTVESQEGRGSTFRLILPVEVVLNAAPAKGSGQALDCADLAGRRVLAAEDHPVNRRILSLLLGPLGCELTLVENGAEAVEAAQAQRFDVILMDMQMPVMDGLEAGRRIRLEGANRDTPIVALTANAMDTHRAAWGPVGVSAFLTKPIDPVLLAETLARACAEDRMQETAAPAIRL